MGSLAKDAIPELSAALKDPVLTVREQAAIAIANADPHDPQLVPILLEAVTDHDPTARFGALEALRKTGSSADATVQTFAHVLASDTDRVMWLTALQALGRIGTPHALDALVHAADNKDFSTRSEAIDAIAGSAGRAYPPAMQALARALDDESDVIRSAASRGLAGLGRPAVLALAAALKSPDLYVRHGAVRALADIQPQSEDVVSALLIALKDQSNSVRSAAAEALQNTTGPARQAALAEQQRQANAELAAKGGDANRWYSAEELIATIPADADHKYPLRLEYLLAIPSDSSDSGDFFVTVHQGKERPSRLAFWAPVGEDKYQRSQVIMAEESGDSDDGFGPPTIFETEVWLANWDRGYYERSSFVHIPELSKERYGGGDLVFAVDTDTNQFFPVEIQPADEWYQKRLRPGEVIYESSNSFAEDRLQSDFGIWNKNDPMCCPTAGEVTGSYKVIKRTGIGEFSYSDKPPPKPTWKMIVDTAKRMPVKPRTPLKPQTPPPYGEKSRFRKRTALLVA
jgi:HEAT repeat protein